MKKQHLFYLSGIVLLSTTTLLQQVQAGFFDKLSSDFQKSLLGTEINNTEPANQPSARTQPKTTNNKIGVAKKTSNIRSGPGTSNKKIGSLGQGEQVSILKTQGEWLQIETSLDGTMTEGWVYAPLITIQSVSQQPVATTTQNDSRNNVFYAGYSKDFQVVKRMMEQGDLKGVENFYDQREAEIVKQKKSRWELIDEIGLLRWMERGTLSLDQGNIDDSIKGFNNAEQILNSRKQNSQAEDLLGSVMGFAAETVTGNEEFVEYPGEGYEKVLMLNYKSFAFMLDGKREAYNVTRRAIDWQNMEKARFQDEVSEAKKKLSEEKQKPEDDSWNSRYKALDTKALSVPSAYVNPFGYYVAGMIQEFESRDDRSLRDNARIAYAKALELNPKSKVLKNAVKDMKKTQSGSGKRLVHVVVADGFAPEKKMLVYNVPTGNGTAPVKLSIYEPVATTVARIEVQTTSGKRLATLSSVADIEAICLRHQKDSEAFRSLRVVLSTTRAIGVNQATKNLGLFGSLLSTSVNEMAAPDMRSWMSLPATMQAARLYLSKNINTIQIVSYDKRGRRLSTKKVKINSNSDGFVYARSINSQLYVNASKPLWMVSGL